MSWDDQFQTIWSYATILTDRIIENRGHLMTQYDLWHEELAAFITSLIIPDRTAEMKKLGVSTLQKEYYSLIKDYSKKKMMKILQSKVFHFLLSTILETG